MKFFKILFFAIVTSTFLFFSCAKKDKTSHESLNPQNPSAVENQDLQASDTATEEDQVEYVAFSKRKVLAALVIEGGIKDSSLNSNYEKNVQPKFQALLCMKENETTSRGVLSLNLDDLLAPIKKTKYIENDPVSEKLIFAVDLEYSYQVSSEKRELSLYPVEHTETLYGPKHGHLYEDDAPTLSLLELPHTNLQDAQLSNVMEYEFEGQTYYLRTELHAIQNGATSSEELDTLDLCEKNKKETLVFVK